MNLLFESLTRWFAPSLVFTCEEAWKARGYKNSIHLEDFLKIPNKYKNNEIINKWNLIKDIRKVVTGALEVKRAEKFIGSSLQAHANIFLSDDNYKKLSKVNLDEVCIISSFDLITSNSKPKFFSLENMNLACFFLYNLYPH